MHVPVSKAPSHQLTGKQLQRLPSALQEQRDQERAEGRQEQPQLQDGVAQQIYFVSVLHLMDSELGIKQRQIQ